MNYEPLITLSGMVSGLRPEVAEFAVEMELKLRKNDHKKSWKEQPIEAHVQLLEIELMEFKVAKEFFGVPEMCGELLDIAAFALIIRDKLRTQVHEPIVGDSGTTLSADEIAILRKVADANRPCTCHPQDRPPICMHRYALSECLDTYGKVYAP